MKGPILADAEVKARRAWAHAALGTGTPVPATTEGTTDGTGRLP